MKRQGRAAGGWTAMILGVVAAAMGCTSLLGIGGDFTLAASGGAGGGAGTSSSGVASGGRGGTSGGGGGASGGSGGSGGGIVESGPVNGEMTNWYYGPQHVILPGGQIPVDFTQPGMTIEALTLGPNGQWHTYPGAGTDDGNFEIDDVPDGPYLLAVNGRYTWMKARQDISLDVFSSIDPSAVALDHDPTAQFAVTNMTPWVDGDVFELFAPVPGAYVFIDDGSILSSPSIGGGDTSVTGSAPWSSINFGPPNLLTSAYATTLFHLGKFGTNAYTTIVDYVADVPVDMVDDDGATFDVAAAFTHVEQNRMFALHADAGAFISATADFHSAGANKAFAFDYQASPVDVDVSGSISATADLVLFSAPAGTMFVNKTFAFGNPFEALGWDAFVYVGSQMDVAITLPGLGPSFARTYACSVCNLKPSDSLFSSELSPVVTPPKNATVDGKPFAHAGVKTLDSLTPTIAWSPPDAGTPGVWDVVALLVTDNGGGGTKVQGVGPTSSTRITPPATELRLPPGRLSPNSYYVFRLTARSCASCDYEKQPYRDRIPNCLGATLSDLFLTPAP